MDAFKEETVSARSPIEYEKKENSRKQPMLERGGLNTTP
jgi:hypothetical protein